MKKQEIWVYAGLTLAAIWVGFWMPGVSKNFEGELNQGESCNVVPGSIYDGDTLQINCAGKVSKVRLCGVDAPEKSQPGGIESRNKLREILAGGKIEFYAIEQDRYGRTVAEIAVSTGEPKEIFVNEKMVSTGNAYHYAQYSKNCPNRSAIAAAEEVARTARAGLWKNPEAQRPWDYRKQNRQQN